MPGMLTSSRISAKSRSSTWRSASSPRTPCTRFWSSSSSIVRKTSSLSGRSSTIRMLASIGSLCGAGRPRNHSCDAVWSVQVSVDHRDSQPRRHRQHQLGVDRLGQVVPRAGLDALLAVALHRLGRHRDDRQCRGSAGILRISRIVSMPSISGIMMSIRTTSTSGCACSAADRIAAVVVRDDHHVVILEHARQREDVADVVVDDQHLLALQHFVRVVQRPRAPCGARRAVDASVAMQAEASPGRAAARRVDLAHAGALGERTPASNSLTSLPLAVEQNRRAVAASRCHYARAGRTPSRRRRERAVEHDAIDRLARSQPRRRLVARRPR